MIRKILNQLKHEGYAVHTFRNWFSDGTPEYIAKKDGKYYYIYLDGLVEFDVYDLKDYLQEKIFKVFGH